MIGFFGSGVVSINLRLRKPETELVFVFMIKWSSKTSHKLWILQEIRPLIKRLYKEEFKECFYVIALGIRQLLIT